MFWKLIETAPVDTLVLVWSPRRGMRIACMECEGAAWYSDGLALYGATAPTHWMSLPDAPVENGNLKSLEGVLDEMRKAKDRWCGDDVDDPEDMWTEYPEFLEKAIPVLEKFFDCPKSGKTDK